MLIFNNIFYKNKKSYLNKVLNNTSLCLIKRFTGNKPVGHAQKILNTISKKEPQLTTSIKPEVHSKNVARKEINEVPFTELPKTDENIPLPHKTMFNYLVSKFKSVTDYVVEASIPKKEPLSKILKELENKNLVEYEDTPEKNKSGLIRLTKEGHTWFNRIKTTNSDKAESLEINDNIYFEAGMLECSTFTEVLLPMQTHLIVVYCSNNDKCIGFLILTSEKDDKHILLSKTQVISGNEDKMQMGRPLDNPLVINKEQFIKHKKATTYLKDENIQKILKNLWKNKFSKITPIEYNASGVTEEDLSKMLSQHTPKPEKKLSHFEQEKRNQKAADKEKKVELNKQKQKEEHQKRSKEHVKKDDEVDSAII